MEGEVPGREPGVLPLVGHGDDVGQREDGSSRRCALSRVPLTVGPAVVVGTGSPSSQSRTVVAVELLAPQQAGERAAERSDGRRPTSRPGSAPSRHRRRPPHVAGDRDSTASKPRPNVCSVGSFAVQAQFAAEPSHPARSLSKRYQNAALVPVAVGVGGCGIAVDDPVAADAVFGVGGAGLAGGAEQQRRRWSRCRTPARAGNGCHVRLTVGAEHHSDPGTHARQAIAAT